MYNIHEKSITIVATYIGSNNYVNSACEHIIYRIEPWNVYIKGLSAKPLVACSIVSII